MFSCCGAGKGRAALNCGHWQGECGSELDYGKSWLWWWVMSLLFDLPGSGKQVCTSIWVHKDSLVSMLSLVILGQQNGPCALDKLNLTSDLSHNFKWEILHPCGSKLLLCTSDCPVSVIWWVFCS